VDAPVRLIERRKFSKSNSAGKSLFLTDRSWPIVADTVWVGGSGPTPPQVGWLVGV